MAAPILQWQPTRQMLSRAILDAVESLPESSRRVFMDVHYRGRTIEEAARLSGRDTEDVRRALASADRRLFAALRDYRYCG